MNAAFIFWHQYFLSGKDCVLKESDSNNFLLLRHEED